MEFPGKRSFCAAECVECHLRGDSERSVSLYFHGGSVLCDRCSECCSVLRCGDVVMCNTAGCGLWAKCETQRRKLFDESGNDEQRENVSAETPQRARGAKRARLHSECVHCRCEKEGREDTVLRAYSDDVYPKELSRDVVARLATYGSLNGAAVLQSVWLAVALLKHVHARPKYRNIFVRVVQGVPMLIKLNADGSEASRVCGTPKALSREPVALAIFDAIADFVAHDERARNAVDAKMLWTNLMEGLEGPQWIYNGLKDLDPGLAGSGI